MFWQNEHEWIRIRSWHERTRRIKGFLVENAHKFQQILPKFNVLSRWVESDLHNFLKILNLQKVLLSPPDTAQLNQNKELEEQSAYEVSY